MLVNMLKSKIHNAIVEDSNLEYEGSLTIPEEFIKKANLLEYEKIEVYNISNGNRFATYVIKGDKFIVNGAAAHLAKTGDRLIIASYTYVELDKIFKPTVVRLKNNKII